MNQPGTNALSPHRLADLREFGDNPRNGASVRRLNQVDAQASSTRINAGYLEDAAEYDCISCSLC